MTDTATFQQTGFFASLAARISRRDRTQTAPTPRWIDDPEMSRQLLHDTGLQYEDLTGQRRYDEKLPFFMQHRPWNC